MYILNNKVITLILGAPGSGKSTMAAMLVNMANEKGIPVYCNYPVKNALQVDVKTMINYNLGDSVLIIDEAGLSFNSRNTKMFSAEHYHWFATTRHRGTQIFIIVQSWKRLDIVLRELATEVILCRRGIFSFTTWKSYSSAIKLIEDRDGNATEFQELFQKLNWRFFWRPKYYHMFDTKHLDKVYQVPDMGEWPLDQFPEYVPYWRRIIRGRKGAAERPLEPGYQGIIPLLSNSACLAWLMYVENRESCAHHVI